MVVGDRIELVGEGRSTATLELIGGQLALLEALAATGTPLVVVLLASKPHVLPPAVMDAAALVWAANPGMQGGRAIAELLLGLIEPSGRLPISFARHVGQLPIYYNQIRGQHGSRYADLTQSPAFAFGEGLSYSTVEYSQLRIVDTELPPTGTVRAHVMLRNTGDRPAHEIVQVYVRDSVTSVSWADKELKAYRHVDLEPGQAITVEITVPVADCTIVDCGGPPDGRTRRLRAAGRMLLARRGSARGGVHRVGRVPGPAGGACPDGGRARLGRGSLVGCDEHDRVEDGACLFRQRRIDRFVELAHRDHSALTVQVDHSVGLALARIGVPASAFLRLIRVDAELAAVAVGDVDVAWDSVVELEPGIVAHCDLDGSGADG